MNDARYLIHNDILSQISKALESGCLKIVFRFNVNPPVRIVHADHGLIWKETYTLLEETKVTHYLLKISDHYFLYHTL